MNTVRIIDEARAMLEAGNLEDCIRYTGEELARADSGWRRAHNNHADRDEIIERLRTMLQLSALHASVLRRANEAQQAFGTGLAVLMAVAVEDAVEPLEYDLLTIVDGTLVDLTQLGTTMVRDEFAETHVPVIIRYLASIEYALYTRLRSTGGPSVNAAYATLSELLPLGAIESPMVTTPDGPADPMHPLPILNDLLGRAAALFGPETL